MLFEPLATWDSYAADIGVEYTQCLEEGLAVADYADLFAAVGKLPPSRQKERIAESLFELVQKAPRAEEYRYREPSTLAKIRSLRRAEPQKLVMPDDETLAKKVEGAWIGRICGCLLGKSVEGMRLHELIPFLKESGNYPMHRYVSIKDAPEEVRARYTYHLSRYTYPDTIEGMPIDDDTTYTVLAQRIIEKYGRDFTSKDMASEWMRAQPKNAYFTAERVAYRNFVNGYLPPVSAAYKNPYREWIGAQIRGDYFGYICPCAPAEAAALAFRDASISHTKNGIYGEMWVAAMLATAAGTADIKAIIAGGLSQIPASSRLHEALTGVVRDYENGVTAEAFAARLCEIYDDKKLHHWCHTISNAMIVTAALLYGEGDYSKSICFAVQCGFDTDCNGATVGSVLGMRGGIDCIDAVWQKPLHDTLHTPLFGVGTVKISDVVAKTLLHIKGEKAE